MQHAARFACLAVFVGLATSAHALMAPEFYRQARADAPFHVQVAIDKVTPPATGPGNCFVEGKIAEVFRDAGNKLPAGTPVSFSVACHREGEQVPVGGASAPPPAGDRGSARACVDELISPRRTSRIAFLMRFARSGKASWLTPRRWAAPRRAGAGVAVRF